MTTRLGKAASFKRKAAAWLAAVAITLGCGTTAFANNSPENDYETDKQAKRTEVWLQKIADIFGEHLLRWYAGHYHMTCAGERYEIVYNEIKKLE